MIKEVLFDTTFLLPFFGIDLDEINQLVDQAYMKFRRLCFAEISVYEVKFKLVSLYRKAKIPFELVDAFWRNYKILVDDPKIQFIEYDEEIDEIVNLLERDNRIELSIIDQIIVATAIKTKVLITLDSEILKYKTPLKQRYDIEVYSLTNLRELLTKK